jgi:hypothetical protein
MPAAPFSSARGNGFRTAFGRRLPPGPRQPADGKRLSAVPRAGRLSGPLTGPVNFLVSALKIGVFRESPRRPEASKTASGRSFEVAAVRFPYDPAGAWADESGLPAPEFSDGPVRILIEGVDDLPRFETVPLAGVDQALDLAVGLGLRLKTVPAKRVAWVSLHLAAGAWLVPAETVFAVGAVSKVHGHAGVLRRMIPSRKDRFQATSSALDREIIFGSGDDGGDLQAE